MPTRTQVMLAALVLGQAMMAYPFAYVAWQRANPQPVPLAQLYPDRVHTEFVDAVRDDCLAAARSLLTQLYMRGA